MLNPQLICDHRDEFAVRWLRLADVDRVAEQAADAVDVAAGPGHLDGMANRALDAGRRCFVFLGNGRIERFRDRAENFDVVVHHRNRFAQVLISFNMRRNADFMYDGRNICIQILGLAQLDDIRLREVM